MHAARHSGHQQRRASATDRQIAARLRTARKRAKLSQEQLAERVGVTFQQIQKYETGPNRISARRLYQIALVLGQPISFFLPPGTADPPRLAAGARSDLERMMELLRTPETVGVYTAYLRITDPEVRRRLLALVRSIASDSA